MSISPVNCKHSFISCEKTKNKDLYINKKRGWDKSPSLSIIFGLSSKTQWLSGLYYADFISFYSPTQLCGGGTTKSNSNELPISVPLSLGIIETLGSIISHGTSWIAEIIHWIISPNLRTHLRKVSKKNLKREPNGSLFVFTSIH